MRQTNQPLRTNATEEKNSLLEIMCAVGRLRDLATLRSSRKGRVRWSRSGTMKKMSRRTCEEEGKEVTEEGKEVRELKEVS